MRNFLLILLGAIIMIVILKVVGKKDLTGSGLGKKFSRLAETQQAANLIRTNEFRELAKTQEFRDFTLGLAGEQIKTLSQALTLK